MNKQVAQHRPEAGAAGIIIELSKGKITVRHIDGGHVLLSRPVEFGFWCNRLWPLLRGECDDVLEALKECHPWVRKWSGASGLLAMVDNAIAKAEGKL